jgi:hypothetical protein
VAGNPGFLQQVSGPGERFVSVLYPGDLVRVSVEKKEYTNAELLVEIYAGGTLLTSRSTTAPGGSIALLIAPASGGPPGMRPVMTSSTGTMGTGQIEYL